MTNRILNCSPIEQLEATVPWFRNLRQVPGGDSDRPHDVYECDFGFSTSIVKLVRRPTGPVGISHEARTLECLEQACIPNLVVPCLHGVYPTQNPESPFDHIIWMSKLEQGLDIKHWNDVLRDVGAMTGRLHQAFEGVADRLQERAYFRISDEQEKRLYALEFAERHLVGKQLRRLRHAFHVANESTRNPVWIHGDLHMRNKVDTANGVGLIDFEHVMKTENPEREFVSFGPKDYDFLRDGYQSTTGVTLDPRLIATYLLVQEVRGMANPDKEKNLATNIVRLKDYLDRPKKFFDPHIPYGLDV